MINADDEQSALAELADFGLTEDQADEVYLWHRGIVEDRERTAGGVAIVRLLSHLTAGHSDGNLRLRLAGVAWGFGLGHLTGYEHQADHAHALGVSRQAVADASKLARRAIAG